MAASYYEFTDEQVNVLQGALQVARDKYRENVVTLKAIPDQDRLAAQFEKQTDDATAMLSFLDAVPTAGGKAYFSSVNEIHNTSDIAKALSACDWSGMSIRNKAVIQTAIAALSATLPSPSLAPETVFIVEGEHWHTPGRLMKVCATQEIAQHEALSLVNILRSDVDLPPETEPENLEKALEQAFEKRAEDTGKDIEEIKGTAGVWIDEQPLARHIASPEDDQDAALQAGMGM
jgi:hypothetical protein